MFQIDLEKTNSFDKFANLALTSNEMNHLFGGDGDSDGSDDSIPNPPIYIKED